MKYRNKIFLHGKHNHIVNKSFEFSLTVIELYIFLIKNNELEVAEKLLKSGTKIRENVEQSLASVSAQEFYNKLSVAYKDAVETRYWLKLLQMKHLVNSSCDQCVDQINEIINILSYMTQNCNRFKIKLNLENLN